MVQVQDLEYVVERFTEWLHASSDHAVLWAVAGLVLAGACVVLLAWENAEARTADQI